MTFGSRQIQKRSLKKFTYFGSQPNHSLSRIDLWLGSQNLQPHYSNYSITPCSAPDHKAVNCPLLLRVNQEVLDTGR